jgi:DNA sulfur modification protein DndD
MKIKILGWEYENIRRIEKLSIDLTKADGSIYENTFIMMPNGTGKTTTLKLIRAMLTEPGASAWKEKDVRSFQPTFKEASSGKFSLKVMFDEDIYYYILHLDYDLGEVRYETSRVAKSGGIEDGHVLPLSLRGILNDEFVNRFIFDGEQAQKTLDTGSEEAERAILYLYQLDKMDQLCNQVDKLVAIKQEEGNSRVTERGVLIYKGKAEKREKKYKDLCSRYAKVSKDLALKKSKRNKYEKRYQNIISNDAEMQNQQQELNQKKQETRRKMTESTARIMSYIRKPYNLQMELHMRLQGLWQNMQTLRLPKNVAKEFFNELSDAPVCICGRCIGEEERKKILENANLYLGQDEFAVLNEVKTALKEYEIDRGLGGEKQRLQKLLSEEQELHNAIDRLAVIMAEKGNLEIMQVKEAVEELDGEIEILERECLRLNTNDYIGNADLTPDNNIHLAYKKMQEAKEIYEKANGTYVFIKKAEKLKSYILSVKKCALEKLKAYIILETNNKVRKIIKNDNVKIKNIIGHLIFEDRDTLSEGQNLAVAYAYIGTLFEHSQNQFPFVVDSPAAALDLNMRREIATVMPGLFQQMIIFVTSGEKQGFVETYYDRSDVKYYTIEGGKDEAAECHEGLPYFEKFQVKGMRI